MNPGQFLEDFGATRRETVGAQTTGEDEIEALKLDAFEKGYRDGWDDSLKAQTEDQTRVSADLERNLQDLSFTFHEARQHILTAIHPLLNQLVDLVLPNLARETMGPRIVEELRRVAENSVDQRVEIVTAPASRPALDRLMDQDFGFPVDVTQDDSLGEGQVLLRLGSGEHQIDMDRVIDDIKAAVAGFIDENNRESAYG